MEKKSGFIWNTAGSFVYSLLNAILLIFCTRLNGTEIAGIFSISYATGCILNAIGDMGIRIYQVTDTNRKYSFSDYFFSRCFAVVLMLVVAVIFVIASGYTNEKLFICLILILIRVIDNFSETFQAEFQLRRQIRYGRKSIAFQKYISHYCIWYF